MHLSVVVPCHDEEGRIGPALARLRAFRTEHPSTELILVDDGSTDGTPTILDAARSRGDIDHMVVLPVNRGKGRALAAGVAVSTGTLVLLSDADLATPLGELPQLADAIAKGADLAIGVRGRSARVTQSLHRRLMGAVFGVLTRTLVLPGIEDSQCGFKLFRGDVARALFASLLVDGFACDVEVLRRARWLGFRVAQVPVAWIDQAGSRVAPLRHSSQMLRDLLRIRLLRRPRGVGESLAPTLAIEAEA